MNYFEFINSVKICAGENSLENLGYELDFLKCKKPLILSDNGIAKVGLLQDILNIIKDSVDISQQFTDIPADSSVDTINQITKFYQEKQCDGIIALGGGSVIDTAKGARMCLSQKGKDILSLMGNEIITKGQHIPFVVLPTTCGTGSECTSVAVIKNHSTGVKMEFISSELLPDVALIDPRLTATLPPRQTAATAMDALCHSIEAYSSKQKNVISDAYAITAIKLIANNLIQVLEKPTPLNKNNLALASTLAGIAFSNAMVGIVHAIGHACGGEVGIPHGNAMMVLLPHCMRYNLNECEAEYDELLLYLAGEEVFAKTDKKDRANKTIEWIINLEQKLNKLTNISLRLQDYGVKEENFDAIAHKALNDGAMIVNKKSANIEQIKQILKSAL